tara:strand:+ start:6537 stop:7181 length:645 start_codon:yes stop_codon:yes gene_type:complete
MSSKNGRPENSKSPLFWALIGVVGTIIVGLIEEYIRRAFDEWGVFSSPSKNIEGVWFAVLGVVSAVGSFLSSNWFLLPASYIAGLLTMVLLVKLEASGPDQSSELSNSNFYVLKDVISAQIYGVESVINDVGFGNPDAAIEEFKPRFKSAMLTLEKLGLTVPAFEKFDQAELAVALKWLKEIYPFVCDGHVKEAMAKSENISAVASAYFASRKN